MSICLSPARAAASRKNGARSQGPKTPEGKARSARNALKHGLCAEKFAVLYDEDEQAFEALEASILEEVAPQGVLQRLLAGRIVRAAWRLERAERIEIELLEFRMDRDGDLARALIRDGNGTRSIDTLMRYRGAALAEFFRALRTLQALQAEAKAIAAPVQAAAETSSAQQRNEPERRTHPGGSRPRPAVAADLAPPRPMRPEQGDPSPVAPPAQCRATEDAAIRVPRPAPQACAAAQGNEPETRANAGDPKRNRVDQPRRRAV